MRTLLDYIIKILIFPFVPLRIINSNYDKYKYQIVLLIIILFSLPSILFLIFPQFSQMPVSGTNRVIIFSINIPICLLLLLYIMSFIIVNMEGFILKLSGNWFYGSASFKNIRTLYTFTFSLFIYQFIILVLLSILDFDINIMIGLAYIVSQILSVLYILLIILRLQQFTKSISFINLIIYYLLSITIYLVLSILLFIPSYFISRSIQNSLYERSETITPYTKTYWRYIKCDKGNCINGNGIATYRFGKWLFIYNGSFKNSKPNGYGEMKLDDKQTIKGNWEDGRYIKE